MRTIVVSVAVSLALIGLGRSAVWPWLATRFEYRRGREALARKEYGRAVALLTDVLQNEPKDVGARAALADAYYGQYVPGGETPDNLGVAGHAREQFLQLLDLDPAHASAIATLARLELGEANFDEAARWCSRLIEVRPNDPESYVIAGSIAWTRFLPARAAARRDAGMSLEDERPIIDARIREQLRAAWLDVLDRAIADVSRAIAIDAQRSDARVLLSALARGRADLARSRSEYEQNMQVATESAANARDARLAITKATAASSTNRDGK